MKSRIGLTIVALAVVALSIFIANKYEAPVEPGVSTKENVQTGGGGQIATNTEPNWPTVSEKPTPLPSQNSSVTKISSAPTVSTPVYSQTPTPLPATTSTSSYDATFSPLQTYADALGAQYETYFVSVRANTTLENLGTSSTADTLVGLNALAKIQSAFAAEVTTLQAPQEVESLAASLASDSNELAQITNTMASDLHKTGAISSADFEAYNQTVIEQGNSLIAIATLIKNANIQFSSNEPGIYIREIVP